MAAFDDPDACGVAGFGQGASGGFNGPSSCLEYECCDHLDCPPGWYCNNQFSFDGCAEQGGVGSTCFLEDAECAPPLVCWPTGECQPDDFCSVPGAACFEDAQCCEGMCAEGDACCRYVAGDVARVLHTTINSQYWCDLSDVAAFRVCVCELECAAECAMDCSLDALLPPVSDGCAQCFTADCASELAAVE